MPSVSSPYYNPTLPVQATGAVAVDRMNPNAGNGALGTGIADAIGGIVGGITYDPDQDPKRQEARLYGAKADAQGIQNGALNSVADQIAATMGLPVDQIKSQLPGIAANWVKSGRDPKDLGTAMGQLISNAGGSEADTRSVNPVPLSTDQSVTKAGQDALISGQNTQATALNDASIAGRTNVASLNNASAESMNSANIAGRAGVAAMGNASAEKIAATSPVSVGPGNTTYPIPGDARFANLPPGPVVSKPRAENIQQAVVDAINNNDVGKASTLEQLQHSRGDNAKSAADATAAYGNLADAANGTDYVNGVRVPSSVNSLDPDLRRKLVARAQEIVASSPPGSIPPGVGMDQAVSELTVRPPVSGVASVFSKLPFTGPPTPNALVPKTVTPSPETSSSAAPSVANTIGNLSNPSTAPQAAPSHQSAIPQITGAADQGCSVLAMTAYM